MSRQTARTIDERLDDLLFDFQFNAGEFDDDTLMKDERREMLADKIRTLFREYA